MNEIKLGNVTVTRVEETHGPIMPAADFFPSIPSGAWDDDRELLVPDHLADGWVKTALQTWVLLGGGHGRVAGARSLQRAFRPGDHRERQQVRHQAVGVVPALRRVAPFDQYGH